MLVALLSVILSVLPFFLSLSLSLSLSVCVSPLPLLLLSLHHPCPPPPPFTPFAPPPSTSPPDKRPRPRPRPHSCIRSLAPLYRRRSSLISRRRVLASRPPPSPPPLRRASTQCWSSLPQSCIRSLAPLYRRRSSHTLESESAHRSRRPSARLAPAPRPFDVSPSNSVCTFFGWPAILDLLTGTCPLRVSSVAISTQTRIFH